MIVLEVLGQDPLEVPLVQHDDMIEAFSARRSDRDRVTPRATAQAIVPMEEGGRSRRFTACPMVRAQPMTVLFTVATMLRNMVASSLSVMCRADRSALPRGAQTPVGSAPQVSARRHG